MQFHRLVGDHAAHVSVWISAVGCQASKPQILKKQSTRLTTFDFPVVKLSGQES